MSRVITKDLPTLTILRESHIIFSLFSWPHDKIASLKGFWETEISWGMLDPV